MEYLLKASLVLCIFHTTYKLFLQKETFFQQNRWYFISGLILCVSFPNIVIPNYITVNASVTPEVSALIANTTETSISSNIEWLDIVKFAYVFGVLIFTVQFIFQFGSLALLLLKHPKNKNGVFTYVIVSSKISPFSFFKWIVYNPESFNDSELKIMLTHEKIHAKDLHSIDILLAEIACVIFWFNPLIWFYKKDLKQNLEYIADYKTQNSISDTKAYQHLLLKTSVANQNVSISNNLYNSLIKERIIMLKKSRSTKTRQLKYLLLLPALAGILMSMNTKDIYVKNISNNTNAKTLTFNSDAFTKSNTITIITKNTTDAELEDLKNALSEKDITFKYKSVKRNKNNEITSIKLEAKSGSSNVKYSSKDDNGINPIKVVYNEEYNRIFILDAKAKTFSYKSTYIDHNDIDSIRVVDDSLNQKNVFVFTNKDTTNAENEDVIIIKKNGEKAKVKTMTSSKKVQLFSSSDDDDTIEVKIEDGTDLGTKKVIVNGNTIKVIKLGEDDENIVVDTEPSSTQKIIIRKDTKSVWINDNDELIELNSDTITDDKIIIHTDNEKTPYYVIDGKPASKKEMSKLKPSEIASINVLKGKNAKTKYGDKGKNGVVEITTKK